MREPLSPGRSISTLASYINKSKKRQRQGLNGAEHILVQATSWPLEKKLTALLWDIPCSHNAFDKHAEPFHECPAFTTNLPTWTWRNWNKEGLERTSSQACIPKGPLTQHVSLKILFYYGNIQMFTKAVRSTTSQLIAQLQKLFSPWLHPALSVILRYVKENAKHNKIHSFSITSKWAYI